MEYEILTTVPLGIHWTTHKACMASGITTNIYEYMLLS